MVRNIFAKIAKETENKLSTFKFNRKLCVVLATIITVTSIGVSTSKLNFPTSNVLALSEGDTPATTVASTSKSTIDNDKNNDGLYEVTIIKYDGKPQVIYMKEDTVRKALNASKTVLGKNDEMNVKLSDDTYDGMTITIDKVKYRVKSITQKLSYKKFKKQYPDESTKKLSKDDRVLVNKTVEIKYVNGEKASEEIKSLSYKKIKSKTIKYSSLKTISELKPSKDFQLDKNGVPVKYKKKITGVASAYSCGTHTATGKRVKPGYIAVNPKQIPYGTKLYIRSSDGNYTYGYASAEDTGGFVAWGNTVADLFFWSESDCVQFGRRSVEIYVLD